MNETFTNPYSGINEEQEAIIDKCLEFGKSHGTPSHFFQNLYYKGLFVGREYNRNNLLEDETKFVIQVPIDAIKAEDHEKYGLHHNGESCEMYACLERVFYNLGLAIEFVELILKDFPGCYGKPEDWQKI